MLPGTQCWCVQRSRPGREHTPPERIGNAAMLLPNWCKVRLLRRLRHATKGPLLSPAANIQVMSNYPYLFSVAVICKRTIILTCIYFSNYLAYLRWLVDNSKFDNIGFIKESGNRLNFALLWFSHYRNTLFCLYVYCSVITKLIICIRTTIVLVTLDCSGSFWCAYA